VLPASNPTAFGGSATPPEVRFTVTVLASMHIREIFVNA